MNETELLNQIELVTSVSDNIVADLYQDGAENIDPEVFHAMKRALRNLHSALALMRLKQEPVAGRI